MSDDKMDSSSALGRLFLAITSNRLFPVAMVIMAVGVMVDGASSLVMGVDPLASSTIILFSLFLAGGVLAYGGTNKQDVEERHTSSQIEQSERRLQVEIERQIDRRVAELVTNAVGQADQAIERIIGNRLDAGIVNALDEAIVRQVDDVAKANRRWKHVEDAFDRVRIKLAGPASRAELYALVALIGAGILAVIGIAVAFYRVKSSGLSIISLVEAVQPSGGTLIWSAALVHAAPWLGLVLLIEFTALLFFRFYLRSIELQRYFTRELADMEVKFAALRIVLDLGSSEQSVETARSLMSADANAMAPEPAGPDAAGAANLVSAIGTALKDIRGGSSAA